MKDEKIADQAKLIEIYMGYLGLLPQVQEVNTSGVEITPADPLAIHGYQRLSRVKAQAAKKAALEYRQKHGITEDLARVEAEGRAQARG